MNPITETNTITTNAWTVDFDAQILTGQIAPSSVAIYNHDFKAYKTWAATQGDYLEAATLDRFITYLARETTRSPKTINRMLSAIKRIIGKAASQGYIDRKVADLFKYVEGVKVKAMKDRLKPNSRTKISPADMRRICEAPNPETLTGIRDRALLLTLASSGCRVNEITTLTASQIHRKGKGFVLTVIGKNQEEAREAPLSVEAHEAIQAWLVERTKITGAWQAVIFTGMQGRSQRPLVTAMDPASAWEAVQKYTKAVGLAHIKPHDFRRFVGTQLAKDDIRKAQKALGHKSIETTARHYVLDELEPGLTDTLF